MQSENIQADYEQLEQMAADMGKEADQLQQLMTVSRQRLEGLLSTAWQGEAAGAYLREMLDDTLPGFKRLVDALRFSGETIQQLQRDFSMAEEEAAGLFGKDDANASNRIGATAATGSGAGEGQSSASLNASVDLGSKSFEWEKKLAGIEGGVEEKAEDKLPWLSAEATLWKNEKELANAAAYEGQYSGEWGSVSGQLGSYDATVGTQGTVDLKKGSLDMEGYFKAGAYAAKGSYSGEFGALSLAADGFVGAELDAHAGVSFKPASGDVGVNAGLDAFAGAKVTANVALKVIDTDVIDITPKVTASAMAGFGVVGKLDAGFHDGKFRFYYKVGAAVKVGAEVGGGVDIDLSGLLAKVAEASQQAQASRMASK